MNARFDPNKIGFRGLVEDDLARMHHWLNQGEVLRWWGDVPVPMSHTVAEYEPRLHGKGDVLSLIVTYDASPVGFVQRYYPRDHPDYWAKQHLPEDAAGIDLFIGEPMYQHQGFGPLMIRRALRSVVFADPATNLCIIDPEPANTIAIRAYEKAGFTYVKTIGPPEHIEPAYLMTLHRDALDQTEIAPPPTHRASERRSDPRNRR
jgi:aminoglycoside 6'-N-acetyltransferase